MISKLEGYSKYVYLATNYWDSIMVNQLMHSQKFCDITALANDMKQKKSLKVWKELFQKKNEEETIFFDSYLRTSLKSAIDFKPTSPKKD